MKAIKTHIFNKKDQVPIFISLLKEYCKSIGLKRKDIHRIAHLVESALLQIISSSFIQGQEGEIVIHLSKEDEALKIKINDFGIPIDTHQLEHHSGSEVASISKVYEALKAYMDDVKYEAKGYKGNELVLVKKLISKKRHHILHHDAEEHVEIQKQSPTQIKLLNKNNASDISRLAFIAYHYSYPYESIYIPEKISEKIEKGIFISAGAILEETGEVVSHAALSISDPNDKTAEIGSAYTDPNYRGYGFFNKLSSFLIDQIAVKKNFFGVFAMAVCTHPYSQKGIHKMGLKDCALLASRAPLLEFEGINSKLQQRESLMVAFRIIGDHEVATIYPPKKHKKMILQIVENIGLKIELGKHPFFHKQFDHLHSNLVVNRDTSFNVANILIQHVGKDIHDQFTFQFSHLKIERFESIYVYLDLSDYHTEKELGFFEKCGFFFAGIIHQNNRINLVLQYLNNQKYDFSALQIDSSFGNELTQYVESNYKNSIEI